MTPIQTCTLTPGCENPREGNSLGCASCNHFNRKAERLRMKEDSAPIRKVSVNQSKLLARYNAKRKPWIRGKKCAVYPNRPATQVHHMQGRVGYADEWARENDIPLLLDERFWLPVSDEGHKQITENPVWAWENKFSFKRITDPIFRKGEPLTS